MHRPLRALAPLLLVLSQALPAADPAPAEAPKADAAPAPAPAPEGARPDPTVAIVAEGRQVYRQRDIDALVLITERQRKGKLPPPDEQLLRVALSRILVAREPLLEALGSLPPSITGKARDALLLDLLDYQAEPSRPAQPDPARPPQADPAKTAAAESARPDAAKAPEPAKEAGPVIVSLPPLTQVRSLDQLGRRQLSLQIALLFPDAATARRFEEKAPLIRDAIVGYVHQLTPAAFAEPSQIEFKRGLQAAIAAKLPDFPADGVLIPQLDAGAPDAKDEH